jgi:hypothetical protein
LGEPKAIQETATPTEAVAIADAPGADVAPGEVEATQQPTLAKKTPKAPKVAKPAKTEPGPREGSKTAQMVAMLQREGGATIGEIIEKMAWQKHTVRGFLAGAMKKAGYTVESVPVLKGKENPDARPEAELVKAAEWQPSPRTDADRQFEFQYQPDGWGKTYRFLALRYEKKSKAGAVATPDQYQLFETPQSIYRVFVTNIWTGQCTRWRRSTPSGLEPRT